jgi:thiamine phosphate synthase YjbQ (UPF0047 family)
MIVTRAFEIKIDAEQFLLDITGQVERLLRNSKLAEGLLTVFIPGNRVALTTVTSEGGKLTGLETVWRKLDLFGGDPLDVQLKIALIGTSLSIPVHRSKLLLHTWQQIVLINFSQEEHWHQVTVQAQGE